MRLRTLTALLCLPLLAACQSTGGKLIPDDLSLGSLIPERILSGEILPEQLGQPAEPQAIAWERRAICDRSDCSLVNVASLHYPDDAPLNALINQNLLRLADAPPQADADDPLELFTDLLFQRQPAGREVWLQAKQIAAHDDLVVIEFSSYLKDNGRGWPGRSFVNYSRQQQRALLPRELFLPEQEFEFWSAVRDAHLNWLRQEGLIANRGFVQQWPFRRTQNIALLQDRILIKYEVNSIAPYEMGHPVLEIPYSRLGGILRPQYLPAARESQDS